MQNKYFKIQHINKINGLKITLGKNRLHFIFSRALGIVIETIDLVFCQRNSLF